MPTHQSILFWKYFDIISLAFILVMVILLVDLYYKRNRQLKPTVSETIAADKVSSVIFSVVMTIFFPLYYAYLWFWVGYSVNAPLHYYILLIIAAVFEMVFVWAPAKERGLSRKVHLAATALVGIMMIVLPVVLLVGGEIGDIGRIAAYIFLAVSASLGMTLATMSIVGHS